MSFLTLKRGRFVNGLLCAAVAAAIPVTAGSATVPNDFHVKFTTSRGDFTVAIIRSQAPHGADRLYDLVRHHVFDGARFYRVVPGFVVQWGYAADPALTRKWIGSIADDAVRTSNLRGTLTFAATSEPNSRSSQLFINFGNNARLDGLGFAPVGRVTSGMTVVDQLYSGYGENPDQGRIAASGNDYLRTEFPKLDYIKTATVIK